MGSNQYRSLGRGNRYRSDRMTPREFAGHLLAGIAMLVTVALLYVVLFIIDDVVRANKATQIPATEYHELDPEPAISRAIVQQVLEENASWE